AIFIAKAIAGSGPAVPVTYGPDPITGLSYSCAAGAPNLHFSDVETSDTFCKHVHYLWALGIVSGCSATEYCPSGSVTRDAMAKFLAGAFPLALDGSQPSLRTDSEVCLRHRRAARPKGLDRPPDSGIRAPLPRPSAPEHSGGRAIELGVPMRYASLRSR